jgi:prolyl oligopeptidase
MKKPKASIAAFILITFTLLFASSTPMPFVDDNTSDLLWLEDRDGARAVQWVSEERERLGTSLLNSAEMKENETLSQEILKANKIVNEAMENKIQVDLHAINLSEGKKYDLVTGNCLKPKFERCLLYLTQAGSYSFDVREFNLVTKKFVTSGFQRLPVRSPSFYAWIDEDTILPDAFVKNGLINSNYHPDTPSIWKRSDPIPKTDLTLTPAKASLKRLMSSYIGEQPLRIVFNVQMQNKRNQQGLLVGTKDLETWFLPPGYRAVAYIKNRLILLKDSVAGRPYKGDIFDVDVQSLKEQKPQVKILYQNLDKEYLNDVFVTESSVFLNLSLNMKNRIVRLKSGETSLRSWTSSTLASPTSGTVKFLDEQSRSKFLRFTHEDSLAPRSLYMFDETLDRILTVTPGRFGFDGSALKVEERFASSKDGTKIPYFLIGKKAMAMDGKTPTVLLGYGADGVTLPNVYRSVTGKLWLEKGGAFAFAHIRGGGGYGEEWHEDARREKKQNSIDDFIAVAEDLVNRGVTSPEHLGIKGANNGGLLVGAAVTQRPDLFEAVFCESPYLDMKRFTKVDGTEKVQEFGDPDVAADATFLNRYSPLHNLSASTTYPEMLFMTSHNDPRVHPAHARKMAQRLKDLNQKYLYYEAADGIDYQGFDGWLARSNALALTFFAEKLGPFPAK